MPGGRGGHSPAMLQLILERGTSPHTGAVQASQSEPDIRAEICQRLPRPPTHRTRGGLNSCHAFMPEAAPGDLILGYAGAQSRNPAATRVPARPNRQLPVPTAARSAGTRMPAIAACSSRPTSPISSGVLHRCCLPDTRRCTGRGAVTLPMQSDQRCGRSTGTPGSPVVELAGWEVPSAVATAGGCIPDRH